MILQTKCHMNLDLELFVGDTGNHIKQVNEVNELCPRINYIKNYLLTKFLKNYKFSNFINLSKRILHVSVHSQNFKTNFNN